MMMDPSTELLQLDGNNGNTVSYANLQIIPQSYQVPCSFLPVGFEFKN